jgi:hypothetical protein
MLAPASWAHSGDVLQGYGTANLDAKLSPNEYGSSCVGPIKRTVGGTAYKFTICEINDTTNQYWGISINDKFNYDAVALWFDNGHDGAIAPGVGANQCAPFPNPVEDAMSFSLIGAGLFTDSYYCKADNIQIGFTDSGQGDGKGGCAPVGASLNDEFCEFSKPLNSGDPDDFALTAGKKLGWCFTYDDKANPADPLGIGGELQYPPRCWLDKNNHKGLLDGSAAKFGDVVTDSGLNALVQAVKQKLAQVLTDCGFCPPDPTRTLDGEVRQTISQLSKQNARGAIASLLAFERSVKGFMKSGKLPPKAQSFVTAARGLRKRILKVPALRGPGPRPAGGARTTKPVLANGSVSSPAP